ncbi:hypothetical protein [Pedobacter antarcticus]|uniref:hypothetical protein n=1 Tax=Pedobacter antarcticus TaxID=34086 RepID=UPI00292EB875|nr:hypothetical protein [Pedobacter antarcticus]
MIRLDKQELEAIKAKLPEGGYKLISSKLNRVTAEAVRKVLNEPNRYNRKVIDAALEVIKEHQEILESQKAIIKSLNS